MYAVPLYYFVIIQKFHVMNSIDSRTISRPTPEPASTSLTALTPTPNPFPLHKPIQQGSALQSRPHVRRPPSVYLVVPMSTGMKPTRQTELLPQPTCSLLIEAAFISTPRAVRTNGFEARVMGSVRKIGESGLALFNSIRPAAGKAVADRPTRIGNLF